MSYSLIELIGLESTPEETIKPNYQIYCDMDGVLTDFQGRFEHFTGVPPDEYEEKYGAAAFWHLVDVQVGLKFWTEMEWMPGGKELWNFIRPYNPILLTSPSRDNTSRVGKNLWVKENLTDPPKVIFAVAKDKQKYASAESILIDDKRSNIQEWTESGGIALRCLYGNVTPVINHLKKLGYNG